MALVSCLCVTRGAAHLLTAIHCFLKQTHVEKELIIVHQGLPDRMHRRIGELLEQEQAPVYAFERSAEQSLGALRNWSLSVAKGRYVCQWDDDDWYHPHRIATQVDWLKTHRVSGCVLGQWFMHDKTTNRMYLSEKRREGWEGSILVKTEAALAVGYPDRRKGEDGIFLSKLRYAKHKIDVLQNLPSLYVYTYHGNNTWDKAHFERLFAQGQELPEESRRQLLAGMDRT